MARHRRTCLFWWECIPAREGGLARDSRIPGLIFAPQTRPPDPTRLPTAGVIRLPSTGRLPAGPSAPSPPVPPRLFSIDRAEDFERQERQERRGGAGAPALAIGRPFTIPKGLLSVVGRAGGPVGAILGSVLDMFLGGRKIGTLQTPQVSPDTARAGTPLQRLDFERRELIREGAIAGLEGAAAGAEEKALAFSRGIVTGLGGDPTAQVTVATIRGIRTVEFAEILAAPEGGTIVVPTSGGGAAGAEAFTSETDPFFAGEDLSIPPEYVGGGAAGAEPF